MIVKKQTNIGNKFMLQNVNMMNDIFYQSTRAVNKAPQILDEYEKESNEPIGQKITTKQIK